jgi:hypothetical protein
MVQAQDITTVVRPYHNISVFERTPGDTLKSTISQSEEKKK